MPKRLSKRKLLANLESAVRRHGVSGRGIMMDRGNQDLTCNLQNFPSAAFPDGWRDMELLAMTDAQLMELFDELEALVSADGTRH